MPTSFDQEKYVVIIGDIIDSKKIANRNEVQQKLKKILSDVNSMYKEEIVAKFKISLGDEFQGLLKNQGNIIKIISVIEEALAPVKLRFGIGIGGVSTDINFDNSLEIDGEAYYRARKMVREIENKKSQYAESNTNIMICSSDEQSLDDELANAVLSVCTALKSKWTNRQREIISAYLRNFENQYKTAEALNIAQSSVNRALNNAEFYSYKEAMNRVDTFFVKRGA